MKSIAYGVCAISLAAFLVGCGPSPEQIRTTAISEYQVGHHDRAMELFQRVLDSNPTDPLSWYYKGRIYHAQKKYANAIHCYQQAIDSDPGFTTARHYLKIAKEDFGDLSDSLDIIPPPREHNLP